MSLRELAKLPGKEALKRLTSIPGVGVYSGRNNPLGGISPGRHLERYHPLGAVFWGDSRKPEGGHRSRRRKPDGTFREMELAGLRLYLKRSRGTGKDLSSVEDNVNKARLR